MFSPPSLNFSMRRERFHADANVDGLFSLGWILMKKPLMMMLEKKMEVLVASFSCDLGVFSCLHLMKKRYSLGYGVFSLKSGLGSIVGGILLAYLL